MFWRMVWNTCLVSAGAISGWKLKDKWDDTLRPVRPSSMLAWASQAWHGISREFSSSDEEEKEGGGGNRRRIRELEEKVARQDEEKEEERREIQRLVARIAAVEDMKYGPSYQHEFPPTLPTTTTTRRP